ncbi:putative Pyrophosphate-energized vacuolar membrane proton pump [Paratrimastix pyriformis]|uniref:H(+)-exporting diphosphatase n=1 Tax=Paratrimastix pyriformis TaxID=342808 RepID=A0ABQ8UNG3_9EUKA|nr:putative Pyrophosphate-energized vacuolar membrane proton pump [Paratrimastix pyriformis]
MGIFAIVQPSEDMWIWVLLGVVLGICLISLGFTFWLLKWVMNHSEGPQEMTRVSGPIRQGATAFLNTQYTTIALFAAGFSVVIFLLYTFVPNSSQDIRPVIMGLVSGLCFLIGAFCSGLSGWFGMYVSVRTNVRCAAAALTSGNDAIKVALRGGAFSGMLIVTLSLLGVGSLYAILHAIFHEVYLWRVPTLIVGYGFGASFVALFAQLGGGIYTKAADVGADLVGKVVGGIPEDDPRNPAVIADLVGDNVGDCAGRGADLFESTAAENIGAMIIGGSVAKCLSSPLSVAGYILFPLIVRGFGLIASMIGIACVYMREKPRRGMGSIQEYESCLEDAQADVEVEDPMTCLNRGYGACLVLCVAGMFGASYWCLRTEEAPNAWWHFALAGTIGISISLVFVFVTTYYTDYRYGPVKSIAQASDSGHATNIIAGLSVGMESTCIPTLVISAAIVGSYYLGYYSGIYQQGRPIAGFYGTAVGTMGMLMCVAFILAMDTFGPISDNAGGIIEMSCDDERARARTDRLDAVGNTTKALTKGYAVGSAALATFLLFSAFLDTVKELVDPNLLSGAGKIIVDLGMPEVFVGGLIGGMLVYLFSSWAIKAVGKTAQKVIEEVTYQWASDSAIREGTRIPDYDRCVRIVTKSALHEMIRPALLIVLSPIVIGVFFRLIGFFVGDALLGARVLAAMLMLATMTGILVGLFLNNGGGAWDNAKKFIERGNYGGKGSKAHKAAVTGDTVGDPCKDTAGPSIHVLIKLLSTITLVLCPIFISPNPTTPLVLNPFENCMLTEAPHEEKRAFSLCVEFQSIAQFALPPANVYVQYQYPYFPGVAAKARTTPPVAASSTAKVKTVRMPRSVSSFTFTVTRSELNLIISAYPLVFELWAAASDPSKNDVQLGVAAFRLGELLLSKPVQTQPTVQMHMAKALPVCSFEDKRAEALRKVCVINVALSFEDLGPTAGVPSALPTPSAFLPAAPTAAPTAAAAAAAAAPSAIASACAPGPAPTLASTGAAAPATEATTRPPEATESPQARQQRLLDLEAWRRAEEMRYRQELQAQSQAYLAQVEATCMRQLQQEQALLNSRGLKADGDLAELTGIESKIRDRRKIVEVSLQDLGMAREAMGRQHAGRLQALQETLKQCKHQCTAERAHLQNRAAALAELAEQGQRDLQQHRARLQEVNALRLELGALDATVRRLADSLRSVNQERAALEADHRRAQECLEKERTQQEYDLAIQRQTAERTGHGLRAASLARQEMAALQRDRGELAALQADLHALSARVREQPLGPSPPPPPSGRPAAEKPTATTSPASPRPDSPPGPPPLARASPTSGPGPMGPPGPLVMAIHSRQQPPPPAQSAFAGAAATRSPSPPTTTSTPSPLPPTTRTTAGATSPSPRVVAGPPVPPCATPATPSGGGPLSSPVLMGAPSGPPLLLGGPSTSLSGAFPPAPGPPSSRPTPAAPTTAEQPVGTRGTAASRIPRGGGHTRPGARRPATAKAAAAAAAGPTRIGRPPSTAAPSAGPRPASRSPAPAPAPALAPAASTTSTPVRRGGLLVPRHGAPPGAASGQPAQPPRRSPPAPAGPGRRAATRGGPVAARSSSTSPAPAPAPAPAFPPPGPASPEQPSEEQPPSPAAPTSPPPPPPPGDGVDGGSPEVLPSQEAPPLWPPEGPQQPLHLGGGPEPGPGGPLDEDQVRLGSPDQSPPARSSPDARWAAHDADADAEGGGQGLGPGDGAPGDGDAGGGYNPEVAVAAAISRIEAQLAAGAPSLSPDSSPVVGRAAARPRASPAPGGPASGAEEDGEEGAGLDGLGLARYPDEEPPAHPADVLGVGLSQSRDLPPPGPGSPPLRGSLPGGMEASTGSADLSLVNAILEQERQHMADLSLSPARGP